MKKLKLKQYKEITKSYPEHYMSIHQRCEKKPGAHVSQKSLFLRDVFKAYVTVLVKKKLDELNIERVIVPKNMIHLLQPLDLTTNNAMKKKKNVRLVIVLQIPSQKKC